jgi:phage terminase large subunit
MATYTKVYKKNLRAFNDSFRRIVNKGGTSSGKTYSILQMLLDIALDRHETSGTIISVISETLPHLKIGAIRDFKKILQERNFVEGRDYSEANYIYTFGLSTIEFFSADSGKATGPRRDIAYLNEVNHIPLPVVQEIELRTLECIIYDFNPTQRFWIEDEVMGLPDSERILITSNYLDNTELSEAIRKEIEMRAARDSNFHRVHVLVEYGQTEGLIYPDWQMVDEMPTGSRESRIFGLDFGFSNDPTVLIEERRFQGASYAHEWLWKAGMTTGDLIRELHQVVINQEEIIADSEDPRMIKELQLSGLNVHPAIKGPGSVNHGISGLKSGPMFITKKSINTIRELRNYSWKRDMNGVYLNTPVDSFNHGLDAWRYAKAHRDLSRGFSGGYRFNSLAGR